MSILDFEWTAVSKAGGAIEQLLPVLDNMFESLKEQGVLDDSTHSALRSGILPKFALSISDAELERRLREGYDFLCVGDVGKAAVSFERLCRLDPLEGRYLYALSTTFQIRGQFEVAAKLYVMSIALGVGGADPHVRLGECLMASNEFSEAKDVLDHAIELAGSDPAQSVAERRARKLRTIVSGKVLAS
ncbi:Chaperone protein IpgC [Labrenzia sp. THAF82]|uniref:tetratricopeptide repeat protein n=1 Tax=Labrenzia sp. THAF82 TaxID=2587861 RepID=UPI00126844FA|nr:tetratricopeptide repeat protein [Labrenzia sp. THAF82]QFT34041.1 Chaperone protein IpgC [Labrenzia sp. THAF82]